MAASVDDLIASLRDENKLVRWEVSKALSLIGEPALESLMARVYDKDPQMKMNVADTLGIMKHERALYALLVLLSDDHPWVRCNAAWALGEIGSKEASQALIELLDDKNPTLMY